jgi:hypothetical protein
MRATAAFKLRRMYGNVDLQNSRCEKWGVRENQLNHDGKEGWEAFQLHFIQFDGSTNLYYRKRV